MSGKVVGWAMEQRTGSPAAKLVLVKLADNAGEDGLCWPSIDLVVSHTELGQSTVYRHLTGLEALGLIKSVEIVAQYGQLTRGFQLCVPATAEHIPARRKVVGSIPAAGKDIPAAGKTIPAAGKEIPAAGMHIEEPSVEPPVEPSAEPSGTAIAVMTGPSDLELAIQAFNEGADRCPKWTHCRERTAQRKKMIDARLKESGLAGWRRAVELAARSAFLGGPVPTSGDHRNWRVTIAWFAKAENFAKIVEGAYPPPGKASDRGLDSAFAGISDFFDART